jgi:tellurite resistance protein TerA
MPIDYNRPPKRPQGGQPPAAPPQPPPAPPQAPSAPPAAPPTGGPGYPPPAAPAYPPPAQPYPPQPPQGQPYPPQPPPGQPYPPQPPSQGQAYPPQPPPGQAFPPPPGQPQGPPQQGSVNLSKVTLTKQAPAVSLTKQGGAGGVIRINLNWTQRQGGGFFKRLASGGSDVDLDIGCLFEFSDGDKGVVQALGNAFEAVPLSGGKPLIWITGDDRSGTSQNGEDMFIDLSRANMIRRVLVFAYIYEGTPNWAAANGIVTIFPASGPQIEVKLDEHDPRAPMCAIALLTNQNGEIVINREVRYVRGAQRILDQTYGWGLNWTPGRK